MRNIKSEKIIKQKLSNNKYAFNSTRSIYKIYCNIFGKFHSLPDFLIIGAKKSGTTSLYRYLSMHPNVQSSATKEIGFFDRYFEKGENWYRMNFPSKGNQNEENSDRFKKITGEATPTYIYHPHAPKRVSKLLKNIKLIVILRNPIDRAYSQYNMEANNHPNEKLTFEEAIEQEPERLEGEFEKMKNDENYFSNNYHTFSYITSSIYADQLERWFKYFPREQFLIINGDELKKDSNGIYKKTLNFLKLSEYKLEKYEAVGKRKYPSMKPETRENLVEFFKPHNKRLYELLGIDFGWDK